MKYLLNRLNNLHQYAVKGLIDFVSYIFVILGLYKIHFKLRKLESSFYLNLNSLVLFEKGQTCKVSRPLQYDNLHQKIIWVVEK